MVVDETSQSGSAAPELVCSSPLCSGCFLKQPRANLMLLIIKEIVFRLEVKASGLASSLFCSGCGDERWYAFLH